MLSYFDTIVLRLIDAVGDSVLLLQHKILIAGGADTSGLKCLAVLGSLLFTEVAYENIVGIALVAHTHGLVNQAIQNTLIVAHLHAISAL